MEFTRQYEGKLVKDALKMAYKTPCIIIAISSIIVTEAFNIVARTLQTLRNKKDSYSAQHKSMIRMKIIAERINGILKYEFGLKEQYPI